MTDNELLPVEGLPPHNLLGSEECFVLLELQYGRKLLGTYQGQCATDPGKIVIRLPNGALVHEDSGSVVRAWYAPMGYRP